MLVNCAHVEFLALGPAADLAPVDIVVAAGLAACPPRDWPVPTHHFVWMLNDGHLSVEISAHGDTPGCIVIGPHYKACGVFCHLWMGAPPWLP
jgi:hypothetical protein